MKTVLITGVSGQDGSYLHEYLKHDNIVHGTTRRQGEVDDLTHFMDLTDQDSVNKVIENVRPDVVYNLAAQTHVGTSFQAPTLTFDVTGMGPIRLLEAIRLTDTNIKFYQASTSELFGTSLAPQSETTPFHPRSPYGVAKLAAYWAVVNYREAYGIHASNGILFNHESPRRHPSFVTRKISLAAARISLGIQKTPLVLGNVDARRDWGCADEYVKAMVSVMDHEDPVDVVIATGETNSVADFARWCFEYCDLDWRVHTVIEQSEMRPAEVPELRGDPSLAKELLGWEAETDAMGLAHWMIQSDLDSVSSEMQVQT